MNELYERFVRRKVLIRTLQKCTDLFGVAINYYSRMKRDPNAIRRLKIRAAKPAAEVRLSF